MIFSLDSSRCSILCTLTSDRTALPAPANGKAKAQPVPSRSIPASKVMVIFAPITSATSNHLSEQL